MKSVDERRQDMADLIITWVRRAKAKEDQVESGVKKADEKSLKVASGS